MNENERNDQTNPDTAAAASDAGASRVTRRRGLSRPALIGIGAGVGLLLVSGAGLAVGLELADDDRGATTVSSQAGDASRTADRDDDRGAGERRDAGGATADSPASDAASLRDAATAALSASGGSGVSSIDVEPGGYEIEVRLDGTTDADVFVSADGTVSAPYDRDGDPTPEPELDLARIERIVAAAQEAASSVATGVVVDSISTSDDRGVAFEVTFRDGRGGEVEVALSDDLAVVATDVDD